MPTISIRGNEMPASPIRKLAPLADAAKQRGVHVFHLNIGQPDLPTPQAAIDAIRNIDRKVLEYSPSAGYRSYREKLVGYYAKFNINLTADDIIITSGGSEAVLFSFLSCLNPGDEIIVPEPAYANYMAFAISAGAKIRTIATTIEEGFSLPKVEKFEELINERTKAILICNPNNPTGYLYTRREMNQIRDLVKKYDLFLFSDEVYREFIYTGSPYISVGAGAQRAGFVFVEDHFVVEQQAEPVVTADADGVFTVDGRANHARPSHREIVFVDTGDATAHCPFIAYAGFEGGCHRSAFEVAVVEVFTFQTLGLRTCAVEHSSLHVVVLVDVGDFKPFLLAEGFEAVVVGCVAERCHQAAATAGCENQGVVTHNGYFRTVLFFQREDVVVVFEQHHTVARHFEGGLCRFWIVGGG